MFLSRLSRLILIQYLDELTKMLNSVESCNPSNLMWAIKHKKCKIVFLYLFIIYQIQTPRRNCNVPSLGRLRVKQPPQLLIWLTISVGCVTFLLQWLPFSILAIKTSQLSSLLSLFWQFMVIYTRDRQTGTFHWNVCVPDFSLIPHSSVVCCSAIKAYPKKYDQNNNK